MCVGVQRVLDGVSVFKCGESLGSCECVYVWTEFGIVGVCVRVDRVWNRVSVRTCWQSLESCWCVYVRTELAIV